MGSQDKTGNSADCGSNQPHQEIRVDSLWNIVFIAGAKIAWNNDTAAGGNAGEKTDDQKDDSAGGTDGGKSIVIRKVADDPCIHHVIQLLKQLTEKQRNGKGQNTAGNRSSCQVDAAFIFFLHKKTSLIQWIWNN